MAELNRREFLEALIATTMYTLVPRDVAHVASEIEFDTVTLRKPAGTQEGDLLLTIIKPIDNSEPDFKVSFGAGWTPIESRGGYTVGYKIAQPDEPAFYHFEKISDAAMVSLPPQEIKSDLDYLTEPMTTDEIRDDSYVRIGQLTGTYAVKG